VDVLGDIFQNLQFSGSNIHTRESMNTKHGSALLGQNHIDRCNSILTKF